AARAYASLLASDFQAAVPQLREVVAHAAPNPTELAPAALGWALMETGHLEEAEKYLQTTPVPTAPAPDAFQCIIFPRIFSLRAKLAEHKGDRPSADRSNRLFRVLTGSQN